MKYSLFIIACLLSPAGLCASADAAFLTSFVYSPNTRAFYLHGGSHNGAIDTIYFKATPARAGAFTNINGGLIAGAPRPAGHAFTYPNRMLYADPGDIEGGLGLSVFGLINTPQELSFTVASLGGTITTANQPDGKLFLGNIVPTGPVAKTSAVVQLFRAGELVTEWVIPPMPEPSSLTLLMLGGAIYAFGQRRRIK